MPEEKKERLRMYEKVFELGTFPLQGNAIGYAWSKEVATNQLLKENYDRVGKQMADQRELRHSWAHKQYDILKGTTKTKKNR